jgi:ferredoxin-nitrite reductase
MDALALAEYLDPSGICEAARHITLDIPITIHFSGCPKSCAYHGASDLTLVGTLLDDRPAYQLFVGTRDRPFGQFLSQILPNHLPHTILKMLQLYQQQRHSPQQSFRAFVDRQSETQLLQWFDASQGEG